MVQSLDALRFIIFNRFVGTAKKVCQFVNYATNIRCCSLALTRSLFANPRIPNLGGRRNQIKFLCQFTQHRLQPRPRSYLSLRELPKMCSRIDASVQKWVFDADQYANTALTDVALMQKKGSMILRMNCSSEKHSHIFLVSIYWNRILYCSASSTIYPEQY